MTRKELEQGAVPFRHMQFWHLAYAATTRAEAAWCPEKNQSSNDPVSAVILAYAAVEALIAEIAAVMVAPSYMQEDNDVGSWAQLLDELEKNKVQVIGKLMVLGIAFPNSSGVRLSRETEPLQSLILLGKLRNQLVHPEASYKEPSWIKPFDDKKLSHDPFPELTNSSDGVPSLGAHWIDRLSTPMVARWACETARRLIVDLLKRITIGPSERTKMLADHLLRHWGKIDSLQTVPELS